MDQAAGAYYALGLDGLGLTLVLLVVIITPVVIIASWRDFDGAGVSAEPIDGRAATIAPKYDARVFSLSSSQSRAVRYSCFWRPTCSCSTCSSR
jgi:NADH:ubiquinone oxidoreductase subunit 4 (subunit M)